ncbi:hypothetical protein N1851_030252 [Merluccius polli]|uniref:Uncharacterized protein n=1 Tax=Merluccius polli TaxID=89951 RepID=A0AA47M601_MERPO|nr:hypothetical protein N1851_030252 [Merluccius polli]
MENNFRTASKRFWTTIRRLRREKQCIVNTVYGGDGALLSSTRDVVDRWKEYFEDLLNPTDTHSGKEAGPGDSGVGSPISGAEVAEVVRKLLDRDLQLSLDRFAAECEAAGMRISTSKSESMVLNRKRGGVHSPGRG